MIMNMNLYTTVLIMTSTQWRIEFMSLSRGKMSFVVTAHTLCSAVGSGGREGSGWREGSGGREEMREGGREGPQGPGA